MSINTEAVHMHVIMNAQRCMHGIQKLHVELSRPACLIYRATAAYRNATCLKKLSQNGPLEIFIWFYMYFKCFMCSNI